MAVKVVYIAGVPASGKSTMIKKLRSLLFGKDSAFKYGKCRGIKSENGQFYMLGVYDGSMFEGTDKLPMDVINDAIAFVNELKQKTEKFVVFAEGDRLFNYRFLNETKATLLLIDASEEELLARHLVRGDTQPETFLKSRRSKVENFASKYKVKRVFNNTEADSKRIINGIITFTNKFINE